MPLKDPYLIGIRDAAPEAERGKIEAKLIELEEGNLRQADYSRQSAEAQATKQRFDDLYSKNSTWYAERQADLQELDSLRAKVAAGTTGDPVITAKPVALPEDVITKKALTEILDTTERGAVAFIAEANALTMRHFKDYGEILNVTDLLSDPQVQKIGLQGVYQQKFKEQIAAKVKAADDAKAEAFRKEGREAVLKEMAGRTHPYPVVGNEASSLDAIEAQTRAGEKFTPKTADDMANEYARLTASRMGGGSGP